MELNLNNLTQDLCTDPHTHGRRILVVEDDESLRPHLLKLIRKIDPDIRVDWATSAEAFLRREEAEGLPPWQKYDLVLSDIYTPGTPTGFDIWKHFAKRSPTTPVILMSGMTQHEFFASMDAMTTTPAYLAKPISGGECRAMINGILTRGVDR